MFAIEDNREEILARLDNIEKMAIKIMKENKEMRANLVLIKDIAKTINHLGIVALCNDATAEEV